MVESFIDSRELHCKRNAKDDMKRMLLNGEYLTKSDVRRKDKELQRKKNTEKRSTTKKKRITKEPRKERQEVSLFLSEFKSQILYF